jgi:GNAT superfamily N-acetyltransferase
MAAQHLIRDLRSADRLAWQDLWERYLVFYEADLPEDRSEFLWHRIFRSDDPVSCIVAEVEDSVVGIAHYFPHADTWEDGLVCYLEDLFVAEPHRKDGIATSLIREIHQRCQHNDWRLLYWTTQADNARARSLYDALTGGTNGHVRYDMEIGRA